MPLTTSLSPDGSKIVFSWNDDIWQVSIDGGEAQKLTSHPAADSRPIYSSDGQSIYFNSNRKGSLQIFKKNCSGGNAIQLSRHTEPTILEDLSRDDQELLTLALRDHSGRNPMRLFSAATSSPNLETLVFDTYATGGKYAPDRSKILFTREGVKTYRKNYKGSQAGQIWLYDRVQKSFTQPVQSQSGVRWPIWAADGKSFFYCSQQNGTFNLFQYHFATELSTQLTFFKNDGVIDPDISADGSQIIFRRLFDLYKIQPKPGSKAQKIEIYHNEASHEALSKTISVTKATSVDFSDSGLEIALTANRDIYVMDTVLREPIALTSSSAHESKPMFGENNNSIYYLKDDGIQTSICRVTRRNSNKFWWESEQFDHETIYLSAPTLTGFTLSPDKKRIAITTADGRLVITDKNGNNPKVLTQTWDSITPQWSPNSKWLTYSQANDNFNRDIFIVRADGSEEPINISQHPDNEFSPTWSPDGKRIAFEGRRFGQNYDVFIVDLFQKEKSSRTKKLEDARKAMDKDPSYEKKTQIEKSNNKIDPNKKENLSENEEKIKEDAPKLEKNSATNTEPEEKPFYLKDLIKRLKKVKTPKPILRFNWAADSERLLVQFKTEKAVYSLDPKTGKSSKISTASGPLHRVEKGDKIYLLNQTVPALINRGKLSNYTFKIQSEILKYEHFKNAFRLAWRTMRDGFYDPLLNNKDWNLVLKKYEDTAARSVNAEAFGRVVEKMLGELNASHTGFKPQPWERKYKADPNLKSVVHLGVTYDPDYVGPGYKVQNVLPNGPATEEYSILEKGDIILQIEGKRIQSNTPKSESLMQITGKEISLKIQNQEGVEREVKILPISYSEARSLTAENQIDFRETLVSKLSNNKLGYIHIARMLWNEFEKFERHIYEKGFEKEGLVIDVRDNGGGFTTDHLLTVLNQKRHAFTIPRNGGVGYPQDRIVYATWEKPIVVLCNQNSFSNAEIFSHAIKTLKRGKLVGTRTAGGVISTGSKNIANAGTMRFPFRGWFTLDGKDMEMNGAVPDITVWPELNDIVSGRDIQLEKAVEVLQDDIQKSEPLHAQPSYRSNP